VFKCFVQLIQWAHKNYDDKQDGSPTLQESLIQLLKYISYNPMMTKEMSTNFKALEQMGLHKMAVDFDNENYPGAEGKRLHLFANKILAACLRENLETDIDALCHTDDEQILAEAQERMYKAEIKHTWDHFNEVINELRVIAHGNRE